MHENSELLLREYGAEYLPKQGMLLEIGPNGFPSTYQAAYATPSLTWHTLDLYEHPQLTFTAKSENQFPIPDNTYDVVLSGQVIEHVRRPWVWMKELSRVCKVGGVVITVNPVSWPYHEAPLDCWRIFPDGMQAIYEDASLDVILSRWESLEDRQYRRHVPGRSAEYQPRKLRLAYQLLGRIGLPVECAYDTITIGRKIAA
ncbi:MAG: methyltransferase domain-containing protein [Phycisphaerae bacterium]|nr:methyltransferase domain-containing protein [Phycisphaerae bacterium]